MIALNKILIVEDRPEITSLISRVIYSWGAGVDIITAGDGQEGLAQIKAEFPNLVITDLEMPNMAGDELVQHLREEQNGYQPLIIGMSAEDQASGRVVLFRNLCDEFLPKPFLTSELAEKIIPLLAAAESTRPSSK